MAVKVKLEKDGFKKDAYVGFSWTTLFLGIWVPSFRLDLKGFLVFLGIMLFQTATILFVILNALKTGEFYILTTIDKTVINTGIKKISHLRLSPLLVSLMYLSHLAIFSSSCASISYSI